MLDAVPILMIKLEVEPPHEHPDVSQPPEGISAPFMVPPTISASWTGVMRVQASTPPPAVALAPGDASTALAVDDASGDAEGVAPNPDATGVGPDEAVPDGAEVELVPHAASITAVEITTQNRT